MKRTRTTCSCLYGTLALLLCACGQEPEQAAEPKFVSAANQVDLPSFDPSWVSAEWTNAAATPMDAVPAWSGRSQTQSWTQVLHKAVVANKSKLESASDRNEFCPGYDQANKLQQEACWVRLISAMVQFESSFKPDGVFTEPSGQKSIGLLSLSPGECANAPKAEDLKIAEKNLACGTAKMAALTARHGYIDGPKGQRGAAAYWSVLRKPYKAHGYNLGKQDKIIAITKEYKTKLAM